MTLNYWIFGLDSFIVIISLVILHLFHFRGSFTMPFLPFFRLFTRYERFLMRFLFKILKSEILYKNRLIRFIPEFVSYFAANGAKPSVYTLQELESALNLVYRNNGGSQNAAAKFGIILRPCPCRDAQGKYSQKLPNITDVVFTNNTRALPKGQDNIFISKEQLFQKLEQFDKVGLVHIVLGCCGEEGFGINVCNCHKSVCFILLAILGRGLRRGLDPSPSIAISELERCKGIQECGKCLQRCQFKARFIINGKSSVNPERCFGCGLCFNTCESGATKMIPRKGYKEIYFPSHWIHGA